MKLIQTALLLSPLALVGPLAADEAAPINLLTNGGFETWEPIKEADKKSPHTAKTKDDKIARGFWFNHEAYERAQDPAFPITVTIAADAAVKHGGQTAVRIDNNTSTDIGAVVLAPMDLSPGKHFVLKGFMKGENITLDPKSGLGTAIWINTGPKTDFWKKKKNELKKPEPRSGTFDWTPFSYEFNSLAEPTQVMVAFQLRRATGTLWFDDIELNEVGDAKTP